MSLAKYKQKRSFGQTPEPQGGQTSGRQLYFVVQKHAASRLHYDFRLEMEGVLKSWAIPKGPSTDPSVKRLAMMVEDHPYDYKDFEGIIPEGNYGAGTVIVWDSGTYEPIDGTRGKAAQEKSLLHQLHEGSLKFVLKGKKLQGEFALVRTKGMAENSWLLIKHRDKYASAADIVKKDKSVLSGKKIEQVARNPSKEWKSNRSTATKKAAAKAAEKKIPQQADEDPDITALLKNGKRSAMPAAVKPMLATLTDKPFDRSDWLYEIKWDGYRALGYLNNGKVKLLSRNLLSFNKKFSTIADALKSWKIKAVIDGEIVAINETGDPDFQALQGYFKHGSKAALAYYVFDLLWYNGKDLTGLPLLERKQILQHIFPATESLIHYSDHIIGDGKAFFHTAVDRGLEGIMAKDMNSTYQKATRSGNWLKIKNNKKTEAIICGYTQGRKSRKHFGAIILGKYKGKELKYIGHTGGGFNERSLKELFARFQPLITDQCPFRVTPATNMPATWLKPELVCEVKFAGVTADGSLRQPIFLGLREDKKAANEKNEKIVAPPKEKKVRKAAKKTAAPRPAASTAKRRRNSTAMLLPEGEKEVTLTIDGQQLTFTHLDKLYWPDEGITKGDMINYYAAIAPYILPYLKNRPHSLNRYPDGISGMHFYQKNVEGKVPDWVQTFPYLSESEGEIKQFLVCKDKASLLYMANLGCIEMHPWHSRTSHPDNPDYCLIDLDPDNNPFNEVIETALVIKEVLDHIGAVSFIKTSGATGIHILIPLGAKYSYDQSRMLAELIVTVAHSRLHDTTSLERNPAKRKGKIYLDFLQNRQIQTMAAAYSLRPRPGATVSAPLRWEEVKKGLKVQDFNIYTIADRLKKEGDPLKPLLGKGINISRILKKLETL